MKSAEEWRAFLSGLTGCSGLQAEEFIRAVQIDALRFATRIVVGPGYERTRITRKASIEIANLIHEYANRLAPSDAGQEAKP